MTKLQLGPVVPCVVFTLTAWVSTTFAQSPDASQALRCVRLLETSVVDFYLPHCVDSRYGGYLEEIDGDRRFVGDEKFLVLQARHVWFFSRLALANIRRDEALAAARSGYDFLRRSFYDDANGGYITKTDRQGNPVDSRKHVYPNSFVIYALVEYHRASGQQQPLTEAMELFDALERHAHDGEHGGYIEFFNRDWQPITDPAESGYVGAVGTKTFNTHLHVLEAFTQLYRATGDPRVARRLGELIVINVATVKHPTLICNVDAWHPDWTVVGDPSRLRTSYGHDVECAWLVLDAADALGWRSSILRGWAGAITDFAIENGYDETHGGFFYTGPAGGPSDDRNKVWWTQAEALVAMLTLHQETGRARYREAFDQTLDFIEEHQVSPNGGWFDTVRVDGSPVDNPRLTSMWQGGYHNGRALLRCAELLRQ